MEILTRRIKRNMKYEQEHPMSKLPFVKRGHCKTAGNKKRQSRGK